MQETGSGGPSDPCTAGRREDARKRGAGGRVTPARRGEGRMPAGAWRTGRDRQGGWQREGSGDAEPGRGRRHAADETLTERPARSGPQLGRAVLGYHRAAREPWDGRRSRRAGTGQAPGLEPSR